jgi:imidazolonepropionase-like amidohydrolase
MVDGGLTPMQGIVAATSGAAAALGLEGVGRIHTGAIADLLIIDGDPLKDPSVLLDPRRIDAVLQAGRLVDAA